MPDNRFNVAVVGYGLSAKVFHIPLVLALPNDFNLYGIVQRSPRPGDDASKDHPNAKLWHSIDEVYSDPAVDVVVITSIPSTHFPMCKAALEAGKHVVVEKPFVPTAKEADELVTIAQKSGKLLTVYQNRRWDSDYLTLRHIISKGHLGEIVEFETHFDRYRPAPPPDTWKAKDAPGHGSIFDLGTHLLDQVYHLFGLPKSVTGFLTVQRREKVEGGAHDSHTVILQYPEKGLMVTAKAAIVSPEEPQFRYWIRGTKGSFRKNGVDVQEDQLKVSSSAYREKGFGVEPESLYGTLTTATGDGGFEKKVYPSVEPATYVEFYRLFAKALREEGEVPVKAEEARDVLRIVEAAIQSSKEERRVGL